MCLFVSLVSEAREINRATLNGKFFAPTDTELTSEHLDTLVTLMEMDEETSDLLNRFLDHMGFDDPQQLIEIIEICFEDDRGGHMQPARAKYFFESEDPPFPMPPPKVTEDSIDIDDKLANATGFESEDYESGKFHVYSSEPHTICLVNRAEAAMINVFETFVHEIVHAMRPITYQVPSVLEYADEDDFLKRYIHLPYGEVEAYRTARRAGFKIRKRFGLNTHETSERSRERLRNGPAEKIRSAHFIEPDGTVYGPPDASGNRQPLHPVLFERFFDHGYGPKWKMFASKVRNQYSRATYMAKTLDSHSRRNAFYYLGFYRDSIPIYSDNIDTFRDNIDVVNGNIKIHESNLERMRPTLERKRTQLARARTENWRNLASHEEGFETQAQKVREQEELLAAARLKIPELEQEIEDSQKKIEDAKIRVAYYEDKIGRIQMDHQRAKSEACAIAKKHGSHLDNDLKQVMRWCNYDHSKKFDMNDPDNYPKDLD